MGNGEGGSDATWGCTLGGLWVGLAAAAGAPPGVAEPRLSGLLGSAAGWPATVSDAAQAVRRRVVCTLNTLLSAEEISSLSRGQKRKNLHWPSQPAPQGPALATWVSRPQRGSSTPQTLRPAPGRGEREGKEIVAGPGFPLDSGANLSFHKAPMQKNTGDSRGRHLVPFHPGRFLSLSAPSVRPAGPRTTREGLVSAPPSQMNKLSPVNL